MDDCPDDFTFHLQRPDRSKCPRQRDFDSFYIKYCGEIFGGRTGTEMFGKLEEKITSLQDHWKEASIEYQSYDRERKMSLLS